MRISDAYLRLAASTERSLTMTFEMSVSKRYSNRWSASIGGAYTWLTDFPTDNFPQAFEGRYFFADFIFSRVWSPSSSAVCAQFILNGIQRPSLVRQEYRL